VLACGLEKERIRRYGVKEVGHEKYDRFAASESIFSGSGVIPGDKVVFSLLWLLTVPAKRWRTCSIYCMM